MTTFAGRAIWPQPFMDRRGNKRAGLVVTVYEAGTLTAATLYTDRTKSDTLPSNSTTTDGQGNLWLYLDPGDYDALIDGVIFPLTVVEDPEDAAAGGAGLPAHLSDADDAHDASAVSFAPAAGVAATNVQSAVVEVAGDTADVAADLAALEAELPDTYDQIGAAAAAAAASVPKSLVDAAGDLLVGTADNTVARLAKGTALQALRVNAGATALEWADAGGSGLPSTFQTKTTTYTAVAGEWIEADATSGGFTVTLPAAPAAGALVAVKKIDASSNTVTIAPSGGGTIDGDANATTATRWAGAVFEHKGSNVWRIAASMSTTGPQGPEGPEGPQGEQGEQGDPGAPGAGSSIVVQDEGSTLATAATTVNFVGAGVIASGTGATKTVTIAGGGGGSSLLSYKIYEPGTAETPWTNSSTYVDLDATNLVLPDFIVPSNGIVLLVLSAMADTNSSGDLGHWWAVGTGAGGAGVIAGSGRPVIGATTAPLVIDRRVLRAIITGLTPGATATNWKWKQKTDSFIWTRFGLQYGAAQMEVWST